MTEAEVLAIALHRVYRRLDDLLSACEGKGVERGAVARARGALPVGYRNSFSTAVKRTGAKHGDV